VRGSPEVSSSVSGKKVPHFPRTLRLDAEGTSSMAHEGTSVHMTQSCGQGHSALPPAADVDCCSLQSTSAGCGSPRYRRSEGRARCHTEHRAHQHRARYGVSTTIMLLMSASMSVQRADTFVTPFLAPANNEIYGGQNILYPLHVRLTRDDYSFASAKTKLECPGGAEFGVCAEVELFTDQLGQTAFVASTNFSHIGNTVKPQTGEDGCLSENVAIMLFKDHYLLECTLQCRRRSKILFNVMREFAGIEKYESVLTRNLFPIGNCILGAHWKGESTYNEMEALLQDLQYVTPLLDPTTCSDPAGKICLWKIVRVLPCTQQYRFSYIFSYITKKF